jgi:TonB family protein
MNLERMQEQVASCKRTERRTLAISLALHMLVLLALTRLAPSTVEEDRLTEVSLLEPGVVAAPSEALAAAPAPAPQTQPGVLREQREEVRFRRSSPGETSPDQESNTALQDRLNERLATLQRSTPSPIVGLAAVTPPTPQLASPSFASAGADRAGSSIALKRGGPEGLGGPPLELARGSDPGGGAPELALPAEKLAAPRAGPPPRAIARSSLAGASLAGPIADRPVLDGMRPEYPEWAKGEAVEGSVTLYFVVSPDGTVQDNVLVQKTAGFADFDDNAAAALRAWRFAPLPAGRSGDQWGTITFHFRLAGGR